MKQIKSEKVYDTGLKPVDTYYRWKRKVGDEEMEFFLYAEPGTEPGRKLFIAEQTTGCNLGVGPLHPLTGVQLTQMALRKGHGTYVPGAKIRHLARACCHRALNNIGHDRFSQFIGMNRLQVMAADSQTRRALGREMTPREKLVEQLCTLRDLQQAKHTPRIQQNLELNIDKVEKLLADMDKEPDCG